MTIRLLVPSDAARYRDLRLRALREWPPAFGTPVEEEERIAIEEFAERLVETKDRCVVGAFVGGELVGCVRVSRYDSSNETHRAYLAGMYVAPEWRRRGHGRALVMHAVGAPGASAGCGG